MQKLIMIKSDTEGIFIKCVNKFLAIVEIEKEEKVHVHDPGRLEKILFPGNRILLRKAGNKTRKTKWDVIAARYKNEWVFANSSYHEKIAESILNRRLILKAEKIKKEYRYLDSRIDFLIDEKLLLEVKGCTLEENGIALFPDAPTARGRRHLAALLHAVKEGYNAAILFLVFVPADCFTPNEDIDADFAKLFYMAVDSGIKVYVIRLKYDGEWVWFEGKLPVC